VQVNTWYKQVKELKRVKEVKDSEHLMQCMHGVQVNT